MKMRPPLMLAIIVATTALPCASTIAATPAISAGSGHLISIDANGTVRTWGSDDHGQLGLGRALFSRTPAPVRGVVPPFTDIASSADTAVAVANDGSVWSWGENWGGQLGDGTKTSRSVPARVGGLPATMAVASSGYFSLALANDESVWAWGVNWFGQLGTGNHANSLVPVKLDSISDVVAISAGDSHALALKSDGTVWSWGRNADGQLGDGTTTDREAPARIAGLPDAIAIAAGNNHSVVVGADGTVWAWGKNEEGQLGDGTVISRSIPVHAVGLTGMTAVSAGNVNTMALKSDGSVWTWGNAPGWFYGPLGDLSNTSRTVGAPVPGLSGIVKISLGTGEHAAAVDREGRLHVWGMNNVGQIGDGSLDFSKGQPVVLVSPVNIATGVRHATVAAGGGHTIAITASGQAWAWGQNNSGQLGDAYPAARPTPMTVAGITNAVAVSAGGNRSIAVRADGTVLTWGDTVSTPAPFPGLTDVTAVAAGGYHNLARLRDGSVRAWGGGSFGQLGDGTNTFVTDTPVTVVGLANVASISAGDQHSVALTADRRVWTWGSNEAGQLGDGTTTNRSVPAPVAGLDDVVAISAGAWHTLVLRSDGSVWGFGSNGYGQLADNLEQMRLLPAPIADLPAATAISAGTVHSLAVLRDGTVRAWSWNSSGNLGDSTFSYGNRIAPATGLTGAATVSAGGGYRGVSTALKADGTVWAWGWNSLGALGEGTYVDRAAPVVVTREGGGGSIAGNDWYLDLKPAIAKTIPPDKIPVFLVQTSGSVATQVNATLQFRAQDVGTHGNVYVFAVAPADQVKGGKSSEALRIGITKSANKADTPIACVLAQLSQSGQLIAVTAAQLQAYLSGVLSAQGASVSILNGVPTGTVTGTTFYVGYGTSGTSMITNGLNRSVATVPGSQYCQPQAPETGWWWNPAEDGRGYSVEVRGSNIFFAAFLYDVSGRSMWYVSTGPVSIDGSFYTGDLLSAKGGQTLGGTYPGFPALTSVGPVNLTFNNASHGTLVWPGGAASIERFNIVPNGLGQPPVAGQPENGWWWNEQESGRGFFMEWQKGTLDIAGYMYDDAGNSVWYLTEGDIAGTAAARSFQGSWWSFGNGQTLTGTWKPNTQLSNNVAPVTIQFSSADTAIMTLPNGRTTNLKRHRF